MTEPRRNDDWEELEALWRDRRSSGPGIGPASSLDVAALSRRVRRRILLSRLLLGAEILVALWALWAAGSFASRQDGPLAAATLIAVVLFVAAALGSSLWSRRGVAGAVVLEPGDYADFTRSRLAARRRALRFGWALLTAEVLFFALWIPWVYERGLLLPYLQLGLLAAAFAGGLLWLGRRGRRQKEALEVFEEAL